MSTISYEELEEIQRYAAALSSDLHLEKTSKLTVDQLRGILDRLTAAVAVVQTAKWLREEGMGAFAALCDSIDEYDAVARS